MAIFPWLGTVISSSIQNLFALAPIVHASRLCCEPGEAVATNLTFALSHVLDESVSPANPHDGAGASVAALARGHGRRGSMAARARPLAAGAASPTPTTARVREIRSWRHRPRALALVAA
jgi:hypothetical protein